MRNQAIGMLQVGVSQWEVAKRFDVLRHSTPVVVRVFIRQNQQVIFQDTTNRLCQLHVTKDTFHVASPWSQRPRRGKLHKIS